MISDRAKKLVEALQSWRDLDSAYATAQRFLDEAWNEGLAASLASSSKALVGEMEAHGAWAQRGPQFVPLSEKIAQTRGQNGETE